MINKNEFRKNSSRSIEYAIKSFVATSPANRLIAFDNEHIFDEPLVGFADGDDSIFQDYKKIIGEFHQTPRETVEMGAWSQISSLLPAQDLMKITWLTASSTITGHAVAVSSAVRREQSPSRDTT